uniref:F-box domain-containing protein n=1 Tax=Setaria viridis TaxID=4556 RepID=A0A4U6URM5_SETVI|nr:hypothetical protein SEVIR_5G349700v2 [Setaria viridis]
MSKQETTLTDPASPATSSPPESPRDYSALRRDALLDIFRRVPHADILRGAGLVRASWRRLAVAEPALWRHIDLSADEDKIVSPKYAPAQWQAMARAAVDRSAGQCQSFRGRADGDFLAYLADRSPALRSIHACHVSWIYMPRRGFIEGVIEKLPLLERLVMSRGYFHASAELLDAGGCYNSCALGYRLRERCQRTIKNLYKNGFLYADVKRGCEMWVPGLRCGSLGSGHNSGGGGAWLHQAALGTGPCSVPYAGGLMLPGLPHRAFRLCAPPTQPQL